MTTAARRALPLFVMVPIALSAGACNPFESGFVKACEAALQETLLAPATYKRVSTFETSEPLSLEDFTRDLGGSEAAYYRRQGHDHAVRSELLITYDAANAFGTPIRGQSLCSYDTIDGDASRADSLFVRIDGKTHTDRLVEAIRKGG
jgi:hypothetical protein